MRSNFTGRFFSSLKKSEMLRAGERVGVGAPGGADSVALLSGLRDMAAKAKQATLRRNPTGRPYYCLIHLS
jgi:tRNA(Ile)-lysidine synthase TilS/MesJ